MEFSHPAPRIRWVIKEYYQDRVARLAKAVGVSPSAFNPMLKESTFPSFPVIAGILKLHPEINPDWLVWGEGPRLRTDDPLHKIKKENEELREAAENMYKLLKKNH